MCVRAQHMSDTWMLAMAQIQKAGAEPSLAAVRKLQPRQPHASDPDFTLLIDCVYIPVETPSDPDMQVRLP